MYYCKEKDENGYVEIHGFETHQDVLDFIRYDKENRWRIGEREIPEGAENIVNH